MHATKWDLCKMSGKLTLKMQSDSTSCTCRQPETETETELPLLFKIICTCAAVEGQSGGGVKLLNEELRQRDLVICAQ